MEAGKLSFLQRSQRLCGRSEMWEKNTRGLYREVVGRLEFRELEDGYRTSLNEGGSLPITSYTLVIKDYSRRLQWVSSGDMYTVADKSP